MGVQTVDDEIKAFGTLYNEHTEFYYQLQRDTYNAWMGRKTAIFMLLGVDATTPTPAG